MFAKWKYKIWKHLTKELVHDDIIKKAAFSHVYGKTHRPNITAPEPKKIIQPSSRAISSSGVVTVKTNDKKTLPHQIIDVMGTYYSGSSALIGFFSEFDNVRSVGYPDFTWSKNKLKDSTSECTFFTLSGFWEMVASFGAPPIDADLSIKEFISKLNELKRNKKGLAHENLPELYGDYFNEISNKFLFSILDLDEYTREYMKDRLFPVQAYEDDDTTFDQCCFTVGKGKGKYYTYRFAPISQEEFHEHVSEFTRDFLAALGGKQMIVYDHLLFRNYMDMLNKHVLPSVKQVVVMRDPRDQFLSGFRRDLKYLPRSAKKFKELYLYRVKEFSPSNPNRLCVRFEDLVLRYEETTKKIMEFVGLDPKNHVAPKSVFDPSLSVANIGAYRYFHQQDFMNDLETSLKQFCFYPEQENLSEEARLLLKSSGNWDGIL